MAVIRLLLPILVLTSAATLAAQHAAEREVVVLDENVWVTFYDLPSRRFREIRNAVLNDDSEAAARDLMLAASYLSIEAGRASDVLGPPLTEVAGRLQRLAGQPESITLRELDGLFARSHWLLAQHFLQEAKASRDARQNRTTGLNLWAATHHMERAILWSGIPVSRANRKTLDQIRDIASRLQKAETREAAYRERPVVRAETLLRKIGKEIDRPVRIFAD